MIKTSIITLEPDTSKLPQLLLALIEYFILLLCVYINPFGFCTVAFVFENNQVKLEKFCVGL